MVIIMNKKEMKIQLKLEKRNLKSIKKNNKAEYKKIKKINKFIKKNNKKLVKVKRPIAEPPKRTLMEELGSSITHGLGAILAIVGLVLLINRSETPTMVVAAVIYMSAMFLMLLNSCLYHSWKWGMTVKRIWRRFDYTSIYLQIAGTFAPIQLIVLERVYGNTGQIIGLIYFILLWITFITGITLTCIFGPERVRKVNFTLYFVGGWSALLMVPAMIHYSIYFTLWIFIGGVVYSLGMIPFGIFRKKSGAHFLWHLFVLAGVIIHYLAILIYIY